MLTPLRVMILFIILILIALYIPMSLTGAVAGWKIDRTSITLNSGESTTINLKALAEREGAFTLGASGPLTTVISDAYLTIKAPPSYKGLSQLTVYGENTLETLVINVAVN